jgi:hypothetical protein
MQWFLTTLNWNFNSKGSVDCFMIAKCTFDLLVFGRTSQYENESSLPIYSYQSSEYTVEHTAKLLVLQDVDETKIARTPPVAVTVNAAFLVNLLISWLWMKKMAAYPQLFE